MAEVKICGITSMEALEASIQAQARYAGFVFYDKSPRHLDSKRAAPLVKAAKDRITTVALLVNPSEAFVDTLLRSLPFDVLQLHGEESPGLCSWLREQHKVRIIKSFPIETEKDLGALEEYEEAIDMALFDAKPPKGALLPGGNAHSFNWGLLSGRQFLVPWMLAGGLTPDNVGQAISQTGAACVDVSSGVESQPGVKDIDKITAFCQAAQTQS